MKPSNIFDRTIDLLAVAAGAIIILLMLGIGAQVVMRYLLHQPIPWVIEVAEYSLLYMSFLGAAWVLRREGHVKMDLVLNQLKPRAQVLLNIITSILGAIVFLIVTWYSAHTTWDLFQLGYIIETYLDPPIWLIIVIIPIGSCLFSIQFLRRSYGYLRSWRAYPSKEESPS